MVALHGGGGGGYVQNKTRTNQKATKQLSMLPLDDIYNKAIPLYMFRYFNNNLPSFFNVFFCLNKDIHKYNTRSSSNVHKFQAPT